MAAIAEINSLPVNLIVVKSTTNKTIKGTPKAKITACIPIDVVP